MRDRQDNGPVTHDREHDHVADHDHAPDHDADHVSHDRLDHDRGRRFGTNEAAARERFGGMNVGAGFFGWLVAVAMAVLLAGIVGAVATAVGSSASVSQSDAQREAGTIGIVAAAVLLAVLALAYFTGGYVAGRMSRFDGGRQGLLVWLIGLVVTILAGVLGAVFGREYNILDRVDLPNIPLSTDQLGWGTAITAAAILLLTLLAAMAGGKLGHRYHNKVDRVAHV